MCNAACRKGFYFLYYLQTVAGGDEPFEAFMRDYLKTFAHGNVDSETFKQYYLDHFKVLLRSWHQGHLADSPRMQSILSLMCSQPFITMALHDLHVDGGAGCASHTRHRLGHMVLQAWCGHSPAALSCTLQSSPRPAQTSVCGCAQVDNCLTLRSCCRHASCEERVRLEPGQGGGGSGPQVRVCIIYHHRCTAF